jgi:hypothetical protein
MVLKVGFLFFNKKECEVFEFTPDEDSDPMEDINGKIWSWTYFFVNKKLKKILFFSCYSQSKESFNNRFFDQEEESNEKNVNFHYPSIYDQDDEMMMDDL